MIRHESWRYSLILIHAGWLMSDVLGIMEPFVLCPFISFILIVRDCVLDWTWHTHRCLVWSCLNCIQVDLICQYVEVFSTYEDIYLALEFGQNGTSPLNTYFIPCHYKFRLCSHTSVTSSLFYFSHIPRAATFSQPREWCPFTSQLCECIGHQIG